MQSEMKIESKKALRLPTKKSVNLARRESNSKNLVTVAVGLVLIALISAGVAKFGVIDPLARLSEAESAYGAVHTQYVQMQDAIGDYAAIEHEYRTYSRNWMQSEKSDLFVSVDRADVLDLLETQLMPNGTVKTVTVKGNTVVVTMSGMNLTQISEMFGALQEQSIVATASLTIASTMEDTPEDELDFSITIILQNEEETA